MCRTAAEAQLNDQWAAQQPDLLLLGLAQFVATNSEVQVHIYRELYSVSGLIFFCFK